MSKKKMDLDGNISLDKIFAALETKFGQYPINKIDGFKIDFENAWVHLRSSNTEPIIRIYTEAPSQLEADKLADEIIAIIGTIQ
jgi:phosphomannomutase